MEILIRTWEKAQEGGIYMLPIFLVSAAMFALIIHCFYTYYALDRSFKHLRKGKDVSGAHSSLSALLAEYCRSRSPVRELNIRLGEELGNNFLSRLGTEGKSVLLCGSVAMLLGLLGTVSGMISSFEAIQVFGVGNTKSFASGISEALLTTQSGLMVGVIGVICGQAIKRLHGRLKLKIFAYIQRIEDNSENQCGIYHGA